MFVGGDKRRSVLQVGETGSPMSNDRRLQLWQIGYRATRPAVHEEVIASREGMLVPSYHPMAEDRVRFPRTGTMRLVCARVPTGSVTRWRPHGRLLPVVAMAAESLRCDWGSRNRRGWGSSRSVPATPPTCRPQLARMTMDNSRPLARRVGGLSGCRRRTGVQITSGADCGFEAGWENPVLRERHRHRRSRAFR